MSTISSRQTRSHENKGIWSTIDSWNLNTKLLAIILAAVLLPQIIAAVFNFSLSRQQTITNVGNDIITVQSRSAGRSIAQFLEQNASMVNSFQFDTQIVDVLNSRNELYVGSEGEILSDLLALDEEWRDGNEFTPLIAEALSSDPLVNPLAATLHNFQDDAQVHAEVFITDVRGGTVASTNLLSDYYQADEEWWQRAWADGNGDFYISDPEFDESLDAQAILIALPIRASGEVIGILRTTLIIDSVAGLLSDLGFGESGRMMLYTSDGTLISDPDGLASDSLSAEFVASLQELDNEILQERSADNVNTLFGSSTVQPAITNSTGGVNELQNTISNLGWIVVARQPVAEALNDLFLSNLFLILATLAASLVGVLLARLLLRPTIAQIAAMEPVFTAVRAGDYSARADVMTGDELGEMAESFNGMLDETTSLIQSDDERSQLQSSIITLLDEVSAVAEGDLTTEAEVRSDITGAIADSFNFMIEQLRDIIHNVQSATLEVTTSANQIRSTAEMLATGSQSQASQIVDTSAAIDEMSVSIQQVSNNASRSAIVGEQARENAQLGAQAVKATIGGMDRIRDEVAQTTDRLGRLEASSREIGKVTKVINDIAARTSILAINASIQASEAGDAGRGFAVVAQEVELLADRSSAASQQINRLVKIIQDETTEVSTAMTSTSREVSRGSHLATEAGQRLDEIETVSAQLSGLIQSISQASKQQARGSEAIAQSMQEIAVVTNRTATGTNEATTSIGKLAILADELRASVSQFKIKA